MTSIAPVGTTVGTIDKQSTRISHGKPGFQIVRHYLKLLGKSCRDLFVFGQISSKSHTLKWPDHFTHT